MEETAAETGEAKGESRRDSGGRKQQMRTGRGKKGKPEHVKGKKLKFKPSKEQRDYETIEAEIASLEEKAERLEEETASAATDFVKLNQLTKEKEEVEALLEQKMERWMYLEDLAARIEAEN